MKKKIKYEVSSGNVFADLNLPHPEEMLVRAEIAMQICSLIKGKELTQEQAALLLGVDQPKISALMNGKLPGFSLERLLGFLNELGQDVIIQVRPMPRTRKKAYTDVNTTNAVDVLPITKRR